MWLIIQGKNGSVTLNLANAVTVLDKVKNEVTVVANYVYVFAFESPEGAENFYSPIMEAVKAGKPYLDTKEAGMRYKAYIFFHYRQLAQDTLKSIDSSLEHLVNLGIKIDE